MQAQQQQPAPAPSAPQKKSDTGGSQTKAAVAGAEGYDAQAAMLAPGGAGGGKIVTAGPELAAAQTRLNDAGFPCGKPDGIMGPKTKGATVGFQGAKGLPATGALDVDTMTALQSAAPAGKGKTEGGPAPVGGQTGGGAGAIITKGPELKAAQEKLNKMGYAAGVPDGFIGPKTRGATSEFQGDKGLGKSGDIDTTTMTTIDDAVASGFVAPSAAKKPGGPAPADKGAEKKGKDDPKGGLEEKKEEAKKKEPLDPATVAKRESEFSSEGQAALAAVKGVGGARLGGGGDTAGKAVDGYPDWFTELQDWLINSAEWTETHERGQNVLYRYAMFKTEASLGYVPGNVEFFFRYIGRSSGNTNSAVKKGMKGAEDLGGFTGGKNWCFQATTGAAEKALAERGLKFKGGIEAWVASRSVNKATAKAGKFWSHMCNDVELGPGDSVSYLGAHHNNNSGHQVTVLESLGGGAFTHVSGNAGGGGSGSVRLGVSKRENVPTWWAPSQQKKDPRPKGDGVWVYSIQKVGDVFAELSKLDGVHASDPRFDTLLTELGLQRLKK